ncbi:aminoglycoside phosphotransferase family protein [Streptomyces triticagri]|uniref:Aminoglycoside phosphotransferase family protein n=1 Tax=Streptomyces triticagri TaxID=2293568 RepID=A0A372LVV6_9ACTN|nr:aminoglycoside phosphotransferase family protein [Streptomyces triticagri]RFU82520.1 aminoglycoside phosphotransferase family protein [Streptomyces triticagri]
MQVNAGQQAMAVVEGIASEVGLEVGDVVVLHDSNKLTVRLVPCDVVARVAPLGDQVAEFEVGLARGLEEVGCPVVGRLDARGGRCVHERDGFVVTLWTYYEGAEAGREVSPDAYAGALRQLHGGLRQLDVAAPHFTERVEAAQRLVADRGRTPELDDAGRELLGDTLRTLRRYVEERGAAEQLLHGEPHPGNVLATADGPMFIDLETVCRGPVEFDLAHAPEEVGAYYPGVDAELLRVCRILVPAIVTVWRWDREDRFPDGRRLGEEWLEQVRAAVGDAQRLAE